MFFYGKKKDFYHLSVIGVLTNKKILYLPHIKLSGRCMFETDKLKHIFRRFSQTRVLVIGDVMLDSYIWGRVKRLSPEAPVPIVDIQKRENRPGGAANVARNLKALGATPILCSYIGDDDKGRDFLHLLNEEGLTAKGIMKSKDRITTVKFRVIGNNNHLLRVDEETTAPLSASETEELLAFIKSMVSEKAIDVIVFEDYDKGVISQELLSQTIAFAAKAGLPVVVDPKKNNFFNYTHIDLFKPNFKELCEGLKVDINPGNTAQIENIVRKFQETQSIDCILVSLSEHGVFVSKKKEAGYLSKHIPAHHRNIADVSGAGDTLISVAALCVAQNLDAEAVAVLSNLAGGIVCEYVGVVPINKDKLFEEALKL